MKQYNNEPAIISLTSWLGRINTVSKTIFSLIKNCPGFHIVLVLDTEEFPNKYNDLPHDLNLFINANLIEVLWVSHDYGAFKKIVFTMDKYKSLPIISADDDCIYKCNYAKELYDLWTTNKKAIVVTKGNIPYYNTYHSNGPTTLHPPYCYGVYGISCLTDSILNRKQDDDYYMVLRHKLGINDTLITSKPYYDYIIPHDDTNGLCETYLRPNYCNETLQIYERDIQI